MKNITINDIFGSPKLSGKGNKKTKIGKLKAYLLAGKVTTPLLAWQRWRIQANTYHRLLNMLKTKYGYKIVSRLNCNSNTGVRYSSHYIDDVT